MSPQEIKLKRLKLDSVILNTLKLLPFFICIGILFRGAEDIDDMFNKLLYILAIIPTIIDLLVSIGASAGKSLRYFKIRAAFLFVDLFLIFPLLDTESSLFFLLFCIILFILSVILNLTTLKKYKKLMLLPENEQQQNSFWRELSPIYVIILFSILYVFVCVTVIQFLFRW